MINSFYTYDKIILVSHHVSLNGVKKTEHFVNHWYISHVRHLDIRDYHYNDNLICTLWISWIKFGWVKTRISLFPFKLFGWSLNSCPLKSSSSRRCFCIIVPIPPSNIMIRSCRVLCILSLTKKNVNFFYTQQLCNIVIKMYTLL